MTRSTPRRHGATARRLFAVAALAASGLTIGNGVGSVAAAPAPTAVVDSTVAFSSMELAAAEAGNQVVTLTQLRRDLDAAGADASVGRGVDIALIDTGVAPVAGLDGPNVVHGPDLSVEGQSDEARHLDSYGHGTHLAGIMVGRRRSDPGVAYGARVVSLKVAGRDGETGLSQIVSAIDWVVEHKDSNGLNIRVLNLSLGQRGVNEHVGDVLSAACERAWDAGIVVVVAAGNGGEVQKHLDSPAVDPFVLAVGATDSVGGGSAASQRVPEWSANGDGERNPDLVVPGRSIASYRVPGSAADVEFPSARVGEDLFRGSGTSQAAAVTSALAARLISLDPTLDPDDVKATLTAGAKPLEVGSTDKAGHGRVAEDTRLVNTPAQTFPKAAGSNSGLTAPTGNTWSGGSWSGGSWSGGSWSGGSWSSGSWSGGSWSDGSWSGGSWSGGSWSGGSWSGGSWSGGDWG